YLFVEVVLVKKIVAIVGSPRPNGNTNYLVDQALEEAAANGCEVEKIMLGDYRINPCMGHDGCASFAKCKIEDDIPMILEKFSNADGTIIATPVYYYTITAQTKIFIDRNYFLYTHSIPLKSKCMGLIVVAGSLGNDFAITAIKRCFRIKGVNANDWPIVSGYASKIGDMKNNSALIAEARQLGKKMAETINR
ncbi:MAG: flavodoxin family protein, partial [Dehalococcoidales bacterium]|nr:flavodoxin family protein [Dehalococcoidales bacterium]